MARLSRGGAWLASAVVGAGGKSPALAGKSARPMAKAVGGPAGDATSRWEVVACLLQSGPEDCKTTDSPPTGSAARLKEIGMLAIEYGYWLPFDASTHGAPIDKMMVVIHVFMALLFVGWGAFFVYCLAKFRAKPGVKAEYEPIHAKPAKFVEIAVVVFEAVLLLGFSMPVWARVKNEFPTAEENPLVIRVVAEQFAWNFHYAGPEGKFGPTKAELINAANPLGLDKSDPDAWGNVQSRNELHIPAGRKIVCRLTSKDVIHDFYLPILRVKQDTIPGEEIPVWFEARPETAGIGADGKEADVACAQLCGVGHTTMRGALVIDSPEQFEKWLAGRRAEQWKGKPRPERK
jgi:cytochrome c oxidase subunit 2